MSSIWAYGKTAMKTRHIHALVLLSLGISLCQAMENMTAREVLERYSANQARLTSFVATIDDRGTSTTSKQAEPLYHRYESEIRVDNSHIFSLLKSWLHLPISDQTLSQPHYSHCLYLWDGQLYHEMHLPSDLKQPKELNLSSEAFNRTALLYCVYGGVPLLGSIFSDSRPIDEVLRTAELISLRADTEEVNGSPCYVIEAKARSGRYKAWFDPNQGYQIVQAHIHVGPGDFYQIWQVKENSYHDLRVENVVVKHIDDAYVPMSSDQIYTKQSPSYSFKSKTHHRVTSIQLNPDHAALKSFEIKLQEGDILDNSDTPTRYEFDPGKHIVFDPYEQRIHYVPKDWTFQVLKGQPLPNLTELSPKLASMARTERALLLYFIDLQQRPSRHSLSGLKSHTLTLSAHGITPILTQMGTVDLANYEDWLNKAGIELPIYQIQGDIEKARFNWGVKSLPWLILTDKEHKVVEEGFKWIELDEMIKEIGQ